MNNGYWKGKFDPKQNDHYRAAFPNNAKETGSSISPQARRSYTRESIRPKDHVTAALLAFFLGIFGVHKFYLGSNQAGFIMMAISIIGGIFTLGIAAAAVEVIAIIEGLIYLTKSQTDFESAYVLKQRDWF